MLYQPGDIVLWGKYKGVIRYVYPENRSYTVTLIHYRGNTFVDRQINQNELTEEKQLELI